MTAVMVLRLRWSPPSSTSALRSDFVFQWIKAYLVAWPVAAITGYFIMPAAQRLTTGS